MEATKAIAAEERARTQMLYDALTPEEKARVDAARAERRAAHIRHCNRNLKMILTFVAVVAVIIAVASCAHAQSRQTPLYDANGHYAGSVFDYGRTQTYTDRSGQIHRVRGQQRQRHDVVLQPERPVLRLSWLVDRPSLQLQQEVGLP
jgi:hypothetical protein